jgi:adenylyltransferase/sulfurtransferase
VAGAPLRPALLRLDAWTGDLARVEVERDPACACCGDRRFEFLDVTRTAWVTTLCGRNSVQITPAEPRPVDLAALARSLGAEVLGGWLRVQVPPHELWIFPDGRVIVRGTTDEVLARTVRDRLLG